MLTQLGSLKRLETENQEAAKQLEDVVARGEVLLTRIQQALHDIAQSHLHCQMLETTVTAPNSSQASTD